MIYQLLDTNGTVNRVPLYFFWKNLIDIQSNLIKIAIY